LPRFNRERRLIELLRKGHAVLLFRSWDTPGVLAAGRAHGEALEHPAGMRWDSPPPAGDKDRRFKQRHVSLGAESRQKMADALARLGT
jgi:hypothetical protein